MISLGVTLTAHKIDFTLKNSLKNASQMAGNALHKWQVLTKHYGEEKLYIQKFESAPNSSCSCYESACSQGRKQHFKLKCYDFSFILKGIWMFSDNVLLFCAVVVQRKLCLCPARRKKLLWVAKSYKDWTIERCTICAFLEKILIWPSWTSILSFASLYRDNVKIVLWLELIGTSQTPILMLQFSLDSRTHLELCNIIR